MEDIVGKTIKAVRRMTPQEASREGWEEHSNVTVIVLSNGSIVYPSQDGEGNGPGKLFGAVAGEDGQLFTLYST